MDSLISVVIPAYNAEKTIKRCVESIQKQTHSNVEIIVVNDGSKDETLNILKNMSKKDDRIRLIDVNNGGVSYARNIGIDNAKGKYITFVDSDDTIEPNMYEHLLSLIEKYDVSIAHCSYSNYNEEGFVSYVGNKGVTIKLSHDETINCLLTGKYFTGSLCTKVYDIKLFKDIRLEQNIKINEDVLANFLLFNNANGSVFTDLCLYNYFNYSNSSTSTTSYIIKCRESNYVAKLIYEYSKGENYERVAKIKLANSELSLLRVFNYNRELCMLNEKKQVKSNIKCFLKDKCFVSKNQFLSAVLLLYCPWLFKVIYYFYDKVRTEKYDPEM